MAYDAKRFSQLGLVYYYFTKWKNNGVIKQIHELLRDKIRKKAGRYESPSCKGASEVIALLKGRFERLIKIVADGSYRGELIEKTKFDRILEIVLRSDHSSKFTVIPPRWVVERTFAWFESYRRLSKDFEYLTGTSEVMIQFATIKLMLNRIKN